MNILIYDLRTVGIELDGAVLLVTVVLLKLPAASCGECARDACSNNTMDTVVGLWYGLSEGWALPTFCPLGPRT